MNAQPRKGTRPTAPPAASAGQEPPRAGPRPTPRTAAPDPRGLIAAVRLWEELQRYRIRVGNQLGAIERAGAAIPIELAKHFERMADSEKELGKLVVREWGTHPLAPWAATVHGLGEHSCAVLVAMLDGDPYIAYPKHWEEPEQANGDPRSISEAPARATISAGANPLPPEQAKVEPRPTTTTPARVLVADEPYARTVGQLWQYCGVGLPGKRRAGMSQEDAFALGKPLLKSRLRLISESFIKAGNDTYRAAYDSAKANVADRNHEAACPQCKAKAGDPWRPGHKHAHALRIVAKRFLQDVYDESKRLHEAGEWR